MAFDYSVTRSKSQKIAALFVMLAAACSVGSQKPPRPADAVREVALTFDDLPPTHGRYEQMRSVTDRLLVILRKENIRAIGFVNEQKLAYQPATTTALLEQWLDAGHDLGNHSYSHVQIDNVSFERYAEDVIRGETVTRSLLEARGRTLRFFRHPQLRTGPTEDYRQKLSAFLKQRGYTVAPVTIDNNDYVYAAAYANAKRSGDNKLRARIADSYFSYMEQVFEHFERLSREFLGREVKQTVLLHANEINADQLDRLIRMMRDRGYRFIALDEALKDPAYGLPDVQSKRGLSWLHRWMLAKGLAMREEPLEPQWVRSAAGF